MNRRVVLAPPKRKVEAKESCHICEDPIPTDDLAGVAAVMK